MNCKSLPLPGPARASPHPTFQRPACCTPTSPLSCGYLASVVSPSPPRQTALITTQAAAGQQCIQTTTVNAVIQPPASAGCEAREQSSPHAAVPVTPESLHQPLPPATRWNMGGLMVALAVFQMSAAAIHPEAANASGGSFTDGTLELFKGFLDEVELLGPWGPALFVGVVMVFEMIPLFPTQPFSLASGLLFGGQEGAVLMLLGVSLAAMNAYLIARGVGRPLAQRVIDAEMSHVAEGGEAGAVAQALAKVEAAVEGGGLWKQALAVALLRLTPVVPFSASNYLLGLTPLQLPAFMLGTVAGMSVWSVVYASLGGASRVLLEEGGEDMGSLLADLGGKAADLSSGAAAWSALVAGVVAAGAFVYSKQQQSLASDPSSPPPTLDMMPSKKIIKPGQGPVWGNKNSTAGRNGSSSNGSGNGSSSARSGNGTAGGKGVPAGKQVKSKSKAEFVSARRDTRP